MNFARLVHILCYIRPYENDLIKEFKWKSMSHLKCKLNIFSNFLFSCKIYLNLYLKWAMTFRSPHFFFSFFLLRFFFFFKKKKWPSFISTIKIFYLSHYKTHLQCSLTSLILLISKVQTIFIFKWALPLVQVCY